MTTAIRAITKFAAPLAVAAVMFAGHASAQDAEVKELKDFCGEMNQIVDGSAGYLKTNQVEIMGRYGSNKCPKLVFGLTQMALDKAKLAGIGAKVLKDMKDAMVELAKTVGLPGELALEEAADKAAEKIIDAAKKKAKDEFKKKLKEYFDNNPVVYKYTTSDSIQGCDFTMTITWDTKEQSFLIRTAGDCKCNEVSVGEVGSKLTGKLGKWQSSVKGVVVVDAKLGAGGFATGLSVDPQSYSGAGICDCDKPKETRRPVNKKISYVQPQPQVDGLALAITAITIGSSIARLGHHGGGHDHVRHGGGGVGGGHGGGLDGLIRR